MGIKFAALKGSCDAVCALLSGGLSRAEKNEEKKHECVLGC